MKIVFFGSTPFTLPTLETLHQQADLRCVITHPDRRGHRGRTVVAPAAKQFALDHGIWVLQPESIRDSEFMDQMVQLEPDFIVVADYGKKIPNALIDLPRYATLNIHPSLLPRHRGASPIPYTLLSGDAEGGVTIIGLTDEMDAGPIHEQQAVPIQPGETAGALEARLAPLGADLLMRAIQNRMAGGAGPREQDHARATRAPMFSKSDGRLDFTEPAKTLERRVRAMQPWPMAYCLLPVTGSTDPVRVNLLTCACDPVANTLTPGTVVTADASGIGIATSEGVLCIRRLQPAGKKQMDVAVFLNGNPVEPGATVG